MKKIIKQEKITSGLFLVEYEDGTQEYRSIEYSFKSSETINQRINNKTQRKSGITGRYETEGEFLKSKKRDNLGITFVMWRKDLIPFSWSKEDAKKYQNLKDKFFKASMDKYQASKFNNNLGSEVYECSNTENLDEIISNKWLEARDKARSYIIREIINFNNTSTNKLNFRGDQERQVKVLLNALINNLFTEGELPPGTGKTIIFHFLKNLVKEYSFYSRININFSDTINNVTEFCWKDYQYCITEGKLLSNPIIICTAKNTDPRIIKSGARVLPVSGGNSFALRELLCEIIESNEEYNFYVTYDSSEDFLKAINNIKNFPKVAYWRDEDHISAKKHIDHKFNAPYRYKHLAEYGCGLTGSAIRRSDESTDKNIIYNGDKEQWGNLDLIVTESEARAWGQIIDQKVLFMPVPSGNSRLKRAIKNNERIRIHLGTSKVDGKRKTVDSRASMVLVKKALVEVTNNIGKHHIHIPVSSKLVARKTIRFINLLQECGLIPQKYKVIQALVEDGNKALEEFNNEEFAIIVGTRWMNRGTDTVKCDCQIYTYVPTSEEVAVQLKGRTHRPHDSKDYSLIVICEFEGNLRDNPLFQIIEKDITGMGYAIVGNDPEVEEIVVESETEDLFPRRNPTLDALNHNEIVVLQGEDSDPELFIELTQFMDAVVGKYYTDENGETYFSRLAKTLKLNKEKCQEAANQCDSRWDFQQRFKPEYRFASYWLFLDEICRNMISLRNSSWTFQMLWDKGTLQKHKNWSLFIQDGNQGKIDNMSEDEIKKVRDYYGNQKSKPVDMLNEITKEYIRTFPSAKEAAKFIGKESSSSEINNCCNKKVMKNGKIKESFGGYRWRRSEINFKLNVK